MKSFEFDLLSKRIESQDAAIQHLSAQIDKLNEAVEKSTKASDTLAEETRILLDWFGSLRGAFKVFDAIGHMAKPVMLIAGAVSAVVGAWIALRGLGR